MEIDLYCIIAILDLEALQNIFRNHKYDYVFHLAAQSYPQTSFISPTDTYETNIIGTQNILSCIKPLSKNCNKFAHLQKFLGE